MTRDAAAEAETKIRAVDGDIAERVLQTDGTNFFRAAKQAANKKPVAQPAAKAAPRRAKVVKDIDVLENVWAQALAKPTPDGHDLAPLIDRAQTAFWELK